MDYQVVSTIIKPKQVKNCEISQKEVKRASNNLKRDQSTAKNRQRNHSKQKVINAPTSANRPRDLFPKLDQESIAFNVINHPRLNTSATRAKDKKKLDIILNSFARLAHMA